MLDRNGTKLKIGDWIEVFSVPSGTIHQITGFSYSGHFAEYQKFTFIGSTYSELCYSSEIEKLSDARLMLLKLEN